MHLITRCQPHSCTEVTPYSLLSYMAGSAAIASGRPQKQQGLMLGDMGPGLRHNVILSLQEVQ